VSATPNRTLVTPRPPFLPFLRKCAKTAARSCPGVSQPPRFRSRTSIAGRCRVVWRHPSGAVLAPVPLPPDSPGAVCLLGRLCGLVVRGE
jgi:hypothetical protein